jgi:uncharacterized protein (UPF0548 family)
MWSLSRPTPEYLDTLLARVAGLPLSYPEEGMSRGSSTPAGYGREAHEVDLAIDFDRAREALVTFATHRLPYLFVHPGNARATIGKDVIVCARLGVVWSINPCRVVYVDESADRCTYGYGTLPGHAEHGEESFTVERLPGGKVRANTVAYAKPQDLLARIGAPVAHQVQRRIKVDYMRALVAATAQPIATPSQQ